MSKDPAAVVQFAELVGGTGSDGFGRVVAVPQRPDAVVGRRGGPDAAGRRRPGSPSRPVRLRRGPECLRRPR